MNIIEINGFRAVVQYDPEIDMLRGEFIGLNGKSLNQWVADALDRSLQAY